MSTGTEIITTTGLVLQRPGTETEELSQPDAEALTQQIRDQSVRLEDLIAKAWHGKAWKSMNYRNWAAYMRGEFGDKRKDSQLYATAHWATMRVLIAADALEIGGSEISEFAAGLRDAHVAVIEDAIPLIRHRTLRAVLEQKKAGKSVTADLFREVLAAQEEELQAVTNHQRVRDAANRLISLAVDVAEVSGDDGGQALVRLASLEPKQRANGTSEDPTEWRDRLYTTLMGSTTWCICSPGSGTRPPRTRRS